MHSEPNPNRVGVRVAYLGKTDTHNEREHDMSNATAAGWTFTATTTHGKRVQHSASSRERARKLRASLERLPFVKDTTTPRKSA